MTNDGYDKSLNLWTSVRASASASKCDGMKECIQICIFFISNKTKTHNESNSKGFDTRPGSNRGQVKKSSFVKPKSYILYTHTVILTQRPEMEWNAWMDECVVDGSV